jgi:hypothetical protein
MQDNKMSTTSYAGIDYGQGTSANRDQATGIRNGVISQNDVGQTWWDESEPWYGTPQEPCECPECEAKVQHPAEWGDTVECECGHTFECELPDCAEPMGHTYEQDGYAAQCGEDGDIFVCRSLYFTYAQFCSPCVPGACYLANPLDEPNDNNKAYCFGHDWFEGGVAPYPVYSVATGELVRAS